MDSIALLLVLVPALPLAAAAATTLLGPRLLGPRTHWPMVAGLSAALLASGALAIEVARQAHDATGTAGYERVVTLGRWLVVEGAFPSFAGGRNLAVEIALRADPLTAAMLLTVTAVALPVAIYSVGFLRGEAGSWRFYTTLSLLVFATLMLAAASNFLLLYIFWEAAGHFAYLLIAFRHDHPAAVAAARKALLAHRVSAGALAAGILLIWTTFGTLSFHDTVVGGAAVPGVLGQAPAALTEGYAGSGLAAIIALALLVAAGSCGAQVPLHGWLADAAVAPPPASALIQGAAGVAAGVYLLARCMTLLVASTEATQVLAVVGGGTALLAAAAALVQTDLKRILAYAAISQAGHAFLALSVGTVAALGAAVFHLVGHAFSMAVLFLGAGNVAYATAGIVDVRQLGGLAHRLPHTHWTFLFGCLAVAGVVPFTGFWSRNRVLLALTGAGEGEGMGLWGVPFAAVLLTALLTAAYSFRVYLLVFRGQTRIGHEAGRRLSEVPLVMTGPLAVLAVCVLLLGGYLEAGNALLDFLARTPSLAWVETAGGCQPCDAAGSGLPGVALASTAATLAGIGLAFGWHRFVEGPLGRGQDRAPRAGTTAFAAPSAGRRTIDGLTRPVSIRPLAALGRLCHWLDDSVLDRLLTAPARLPAVLGALLRPLSTGLIPFYALAMVLGLLALIAALAGLR